MVLGYHIQYIKDLNDTIHYIQVSCTWVLAYHIQYIKDLNLKIIIKQLGIST